MRKVALMSGLAGLSLFPLASLAWNDFSYSEESEIYREQSYPAFESEEHVYHGRPVQFVSSPTVYRDRVYHIDRDEMRPRNYHEEREINIDVDDDDD